MWPPRWEAEVFMLAWDSFGSSPFRLEQLFDVIAMDKDQVRVAVSRLARRRWIIRIGRGRYLAKPLELVMASQELYFRAVNAVRSAGIASPTFIIGSVADLLASRASDVDLLVVAEDGWDEAERKLPDFHLTFVKPGHLRDPNFFLYTAVKRGVQLTSKADVAEVRFDPEILLSEAVKSYETAEVNDRIYEPQLIHAAGFAARFILYKNHFLPPTSSMGAILELVRVDEAFLTAFKELEVDTRGACERVMKWAKGIQRTSA